MMDRFARLNLNRIAITGGTLLLAAGSLSGQSYAPSPVKTMGEASSTMEWVMAFVFLVGCLVVAFKPAKRSNLK